MRNGHVDMLSRRPFRQLLWTSMCNQYVLNKGIPCYSSIKEFVTLCSSNYRWIRHPVLQTDVVRRKIERYRPGNGPLSTSQWITPHFHLFHTSSNQLVLDVDNYDKLAIYDKSGQALENARVSDVQAQKKYGSKGHENPLVLNNDLVKYLTEVLQPYLSGPHQEIHEISAGSGILTKALLEGGVHHMTAWEQSNKLFGSLQDVEKCFPGRLTVRQGTFTSHSIHEPQTAYVDWLTQWKLEPTLKLIGLFYDDAAYRRFFGHVIHALQHRIFPFHNGRPELLVLVCSHEYACATLKRSQLRGRLTYRHIFYKLLWQVETLAKVPCTDFNITTKTFLNWRLMEDCLDTDSMYVLRLIPRLDLFEAICSWNQLPGLVFFITKINKNAGQRLIPLIEQWCPELGTVLLKMGYTMMDKVKDLEHQDLVHIYKEMLAWPSDSHSGLRMEMEKCCHL